MMKKRTHVLCLVVKDTTRHELIKDTLITILAWVGSFFLLMLGTMLTPSAEVFNIWTGFGLLGGIIFFLLPPVIIISLFVFLIQPRGLICTKQQYLKLLRPEIHMEVRRNREDKEYEEWQRNFNTKVANAKETLWAILNQKQLEELNAIREYIGPALRTIYPLSDDAYKDDQEGREEI